VAYQLYSQQQTKEITASLGLPMASKILKDHFKAKIDRGSGRKLVIERYLGKPSLKKL